jgi:flagellar hook-length control protein FliK
MNVAPVASTPMPARAADAPSPAAAAFSGLLEMATGTAGDATQGAQPGTAPTAAQPVEPAAPQQAAIATTAADPLPTLSPPPRDEAPAVAPDQSLATAPTADAGLPVKPTPATSPATAAPAPKPANGADTLIAQVRPWQAAPTDPTVTPKPVANDDAEDAGEGDGKGVGTTKVKSAKASPPMAADDAQQPQSVVLAATPATVLQPAANQTPRQSGDNADGIDATAGGTSPSATIPAQHDLTAAAPNGPDNLPPLLASQTPTMAQPIRQVPVYSPSPALQNSPVVPAEPGRIGRDIGVEIARQVAAGKDEVTIRLSPAEMGRVDVRLSFDSKGALHAAVRADSPQALDLLRRDAGDLGRSLADAGIRTDSSSFSFDSRDNGPGQFAQQHQQQHGHPSGGDARARHAGGALRDADDSDALASLPYRQLRASGRVDLMA